MGHSNSLYMAWHGMASRTFGRALVRQELASYIPLHWEDLLWVAGTFPPALLR